MEEAPVSHNAGKARNQAKLKSDAQGEEPSLSIADEELVARAQQGDQGAAEDLYNRYQKKAHAIAYHMCGGDWEEARDLTQEAFLKVFGMLKKFRQDSSFYTWFYRILVNTCLDSRRKRRRWERFLPFRRSEKREKERAANGVEEHAGTGAGFDPAGAARGQQLNQDVRNALMALPQKQQVAFQLKVFEGMSIAEIAQIMGSAKGTVKSHLFRATHSLREALKGWNVS